MIIKTQAEWDALPTQFDSHTVIEIQCPKGTRVAIARVPGNSSVVAWENSSVVAGGDSSVEAWGNSFCRNFSPNAKIELCGESIALLQVDGATAIRKSGSAHIIQAPKPAWTVEGWLDREGVLAVDGSGILYKRVSADFKTQETRPWETTWNIGSKLSHSNWQPDSGECGSGKFHACSRPYFCDEFREEKSDVYVAIRVAVADLHAWPNPQYPHKIAFRACVVLYQCDRMGKEIAVKAVTA